MALDNYNPATALSAYYPTRDERRPARLWATEKLLHDMAELGMVEFFEGPGTDPTGIDGYDIGKLWLRVSSGVTNEPGEVRAYDNVGDATLLASWPRLTSAAFLAFVGVDSKMLVVPVGSVGNIAALDTTKWQQARITHGSRAGTFVWQAGNYSAQVTADPGQGVYVASASDPSGSAGCWVRLHNNELLATWFGAVGDDATDNTTAFQRMINLAASDYRLRRARIPTGVYRTTTLTIAQHMTLVGDGIQRTVLNFTNADDDCILIDHGDATLTGMRISDMRISATTQKTSGWGLRQTCNDGAALYWFTMSDVLFGDNMLNGWTLQSSYFATIRRTDVIQVGNGATGIRLMGASDTRRVVETTISNCNVRNGSGGSSIGLLIDSFAEGIWLSGMALEKSGTGYGMFIRNSLYPTDPDAEDSVKNIYGTQICCDRNGFSCLRIQAGRTIHFTNSWFTSALNNHGVHITGGFDMSFNDCDISNNAQNGARVNTPASDIVFNACGIHTNSAGTGNAGLYSGILVQNNTDNVTVNGCQFYRLPGSTKKHKHAVEIEGGSSDGYVITNNRDGGSLEAISYYDGANAARSVIKNNVDGATDTTVTAASAYGTDNRLLRSDGAGRGSQSSGITVDDSNNVSGIGTLATSGNAGHGAAAEVGGARLLMSGADFSESALSHIRTSGPYRWNYGITSTGAWLLRSGSLSAGTDVMGVTAAGAVRFYTYGAGTLTTDANGNITATSDERLKDGITAWTTGLAAIQQIVPIEYTWSEASGFDRENRYAGFSAQNVQSAIPDAVGVGADGFMTVQDRPLLAAAFNAIKELKALNDNLVARVEALEAAAAVT